MDDDIERLELLREATNLDVNEVMALAKVSKHDALTTTYVTNVQDRVPEENPLNILCEAVALIERKWGRTRRPRMRFNDMEKAEMIEMAEKLQWKWGSDPAALERAGVFKFCVERPGRVDVSQFIDWMGRNRKKYQGAGTS